MTFTATYLIAATTAVLILQIITHRRITQMTMTVSDAFKAMDKETTRLAGVFDKLIKKANTEGLDEAEEAQAKALIAHLRAIGSDPENPVPPAPDAEPSITPDQAPDPSANPTTSQT